MLFVVICTSLMLLCGLFGWSADRRARAVRSKLLRRLIRGLFALFFVSMGLYPLIPLSRAILESEPEFPPAAWATPAYLWLPVVMPMTVLCWLGWKAVRLGLWLVRRGKRSAAASMQPDQPAMPVDSPFETAGNDSNTTTDRNESSDLTSAESDVVPTTADAGSEARMSRREALALATAAFPPLLTCGLSVAALAERGGFAVREVSLSLRTLPGDLDGLTICHLTDLHAGNFFPNDAIGRVADAAGAMKADLVVFTGDLIDRGLLDRIPAGLRLFDHIDRSRFAIIEGNHDIQANAEEFEKTIQEEKLPFLLDEQLICQVAGRSTPIQFLGITWGESMVDSDMSMNPRPVRKQSMEATTASVRRVSAMRKPGAFPILLAHHPHAFDPAVDAGLPLTLAGHTHGGQVMLTRNIGAGPMRFRYWSGEHQRNDSHMVICNGLGSWFPLRVNAQAEILKITLRRA